MVTLLFMLLGAIASIVAFNGVAAISGYYSLSFLYSVVWALSLLIYRLFFKSGFIRDQILLIMLGNVKLTWEFIGNLLSGILVSLSWTLSINFAFYKAAQWIASL